MLNDGYIKDALAANVQLRFKVAEQLERWINGDEPLSQYMKHARTEMLSKTDIQYQHLTLQALVAQWKVFRETMMIIYLTDVIIDRYEKYIYSPHVYIIMVII